MSQPSLNHHVFGIKITPPNPNPNNTRKEPNCTVICSKGARDFFKKDIHEICCFLFAIRFLLNRPCISSLSLIHRQWRRKAALGPRFFTSCVACGLFRIKPNASPTLVWRNITRYHMFGEVLRNIYQMCSDVCHKFIEKMHFFALS